MGGRNGRSEASLECSRLVEEPKATIVHLLQAKHQPWLQEVALHVSCERYHSCCMRPQQTFRKVSLRLVGFSSLAAHKPLGMRTDHLHRRWRVASLAPRRFKVAQCRF